MAQLPSVGDKVLYHSKPDREIALQGFLSYNKFKVVVKLNRNEREKEQSDGNFRELLLRLRSGESTVEDWQLLLENS